MVSKLRMICNQTADAKGAQLEEMLVEEKERLHAKAAEMAEMEERLEDEQREKLGAAEEDAEQKLAQLQVRGAAFYYGLFPYNR